MSQGKIQITGGKQWSDSIGTDAEWATGEPADEMLIQITGEEIDKLDDIPLGRRDENQILADRTVNPMTSHTVIHGYSGINFKSFLVELAQRGFRFINVHRFQKEGRANKTASLFFTRTGSDPTGSIPVALQELLNERRFSSLWLHVNIRNSDGFRRDCINCVVGKTGVEGSASLQIAGFADDDYHVVYPRITIDEIAKRNDVDRKTVVHIMIDQGKTVRPEHGDTVPYRWLKDISKAIRASRKAT